MAHPVIHFEIGCKDLSSTSRFFSQVFGWKTEPYGSAEMIQTGAEEGIQGHINALGHEPHQYVLFYIQVDDLEACLATIEAAGGKTVVPPSEVPGAGHFAWFSDPGGNTLGIWKPLSQSGRLGKPASAIEV